MSAPEIITFGCRLNAFESEVIRRARREHPGARIIVTGCAATLAPRLYAAMPEVDRVLDNDAKLRAESYLPTPAPHPDPLPASGAREYRRKFPLPAPAERVRVRGAFATTRRHQ